MKRWLKILWRILIIGFIIFIGFTGLMIYVIGKAMDDCSQSLEKPTNIPQSAVWSGECETGNWINLVEIHDGKYRFMLYGCDGALVLDADFVVKGEPNYRQIINEDNWQDKILTYKVDADFVNIKGGELELVLPAYGGEYWDKDKGTFIWDNDKDTDKSTDTIANMPS
mgnify:CR=1 FL=1